MIISHLDQVKSAEVAYKEAVNVTVKVPISPKEGWKGHVMRVFEIGEGGYTPRHEHPWPHINYILSGKGVLHLEGKDYPVEAGSFAYVPAGGKHQFTNRGEEAFQFICIVPEEGHK